MKCLYIFDLLTGIIKLHTLLFIVNPLIFYILTHQRNGLHRTVYPAELQLDVRLQNDEAECRNEMHGAGVVS